MANKLKIYYAEKLWEFEPKSDNGFIRVILLQEYQKTIKILTNYINFLKSSEKNINKRTLDRLTKIIKNSC